MSVPEVRTSARVIHFSNVTGNTSAFAAKLALPSATVPLREGHLVARQPYILITPTYGSGRGRRLVPRQVADFLRDQGNRALIRGVIATGNRNFGPDFARAGDVISDRCGVPLLHKLEMRGTPHDVATVLERMSAPWEQLS